jgi:hypothetical protein
MLLVYSVHLKSNRGALEEDIAKREEAARHLLAHASEMETLYSKSAKVARVIAGDFNILIQQIHVSPLSRLSQSARGRS